MTQERSVTMIPQPVVGSPSCAMATDLDGQTASTAATLSERGSTSRLRRYSTAVQAEVSGDISFGTVFLDMTRISLEDGNKTCKAALGYSFAAGTSDGNCIQRRSCRVKWNRSWDVRFLPRTDGAKFFLGFDQ